VTRRGREDGSGQARRRIENRTAQLPIWSRILYKIEHYTVLPAVALAATVVVMGVVASIFIRGFPGDWVDGFEISVSSVTLVMVFAIQHTQGREQAATQRKLDELIRALPGANESLMMLEEASRHDMLRVEDEQRDVRSKAPGGEEDPEGSIG
jgi:low affinity Fe/Cu permease